MAGKLNLTFYDGTMDRFDYQKLLQEHLYPQANQLWGRGMWVLAQDGATCHTADSTETDILAHAHEILPWPGHHQT